MLTFEKRGIIYMMFLIKCFQDMHYIKQLLADQSSSLDAWNDRSCYLRTIVIESI